LQQKLKNGGWEPGRERKDVSRGPQDQKTIGQQKAVLITKTAPAKALEELFICINPLTL
jgi:hypothetical protein